MSSGLFRSRVAPDGIPIAQDLADAIIDDLGIVEIEAVQTYELGGADGERRSEIEQQVERQLNRSLGDHIARYGVSEVTITRAHKSKYYVHDYSNCMVAKAWVITKPESKP
jgi:hypothetical protein